MEQNKEYNCVQNNEVGKCAEKPLSQNGFKFGSTALEIWN